MRLDHVRLAFLFGAQIWLLSPAATTGGFRQHADSVLRFPVTWNGVSPFLPGMFLRD